MTTEVIAIAIESKRKTGDGYSSKDPQLASGPDLKNPKRIGSPTLHASDHSLPHHTQILSQPPPVRLQEIVVEFIPRISDDVGEFECNAEVP